METLRPDIGVLLTPGDRAALDSMDYSKTSIDATNENIS